MKDYWGTMLIGILLGVSVTLLYTGNEKELRRAKRKMRAKSRSAMDFVTNVSQEAGDIIREQE
ncbi:MAG: hypothetical protein PHT79_10115 [Syntrophomonadaceae bacterium]|nr:hypothetical protein [Syntrophomonadaceae bacterium]MDD4550097.1 hypothetical protein [Syntrophomonadaceae bacterium]